MVMPVNACFLLKLILKLSLCWIAIIIIFLDIHCFRTHFLSNCILSWLSQPAGATIISATGASALPLCPSPAPHSHLPREGSPKKHSTVRIVPQCRPASLRSRSDLPQAYPQIAVSQLAQTACVVGRPGPHPTQFLAAKERTKSYVPSLLDADVEGQSRDYTVPLCRMRSKTSRPSIYELEKEFLS